MIIMLGCGMRLRWSLAQGRELIFYKPLISLASVFMVVVIIFHLHYVLVAKPNHVRVLEIAGFVLNEYFRLNGFAFFENVRLRWSR